MLSQRFILTPRCEPRSAVTRPHYNVYDSQHLDHNDEPGLVFIGPLTHCELYVYEKETER